MLCLTRKVEESLVLQSPDGKVIAKIKVLAHHGGFTRLGIEASRDEVRVIRSELLSLPNYRKESRQAKV